MIERMSAKEKKEKMVFYYDVLFTVIEGCKSTNRYLIRSRYTKFYVLSVPSRGCRDEKGKLYFAWRYIQIMNTANGNLSSSTSILN